MRGGKVNGYRDNPFDPVPNIASFNTLNPVKIIGSISRFRLSFGAERTEASMLCHTKEGLIEICVPEVHYAGVVCLL
jgi:hypothetical protein